MEFEGVNENVKWEIQRVAAAFGVKEWISWEMSEISYRYAVYPTVICLAVTSSGETIRFEVELNLEVFSLQIGEEDEDKDLYATTLKAQRYEGFMSFSTLCPYRYYVFARGMYCLGWECCGFDLSSYLSGVSSSLTAHEKTELRLSLPREFWPQKWLDGEKPD